MSGQPNKNNGGDKGDNNRKDDKSNEKLPPLYIRDPRYWTPDPLGLATCPPDRIELRPGQRHPLLLNRDHPATVRPKKDAAHFKKWGAIEKPADGENAKKADSDRCLTCINLGSKCHGTDVVDGRCRSCRGIPVNAGSTRRLRVCQWLDRSAGILTYADAQRASNSRTIPRNTRPVMPPPSYQQPVDPRLNTPDYFSWDPEDGEFETLSGLVANLWDAGRFTTHGWTNVIRIRDEATSRRQQLEARLSAEQLANSHLAAHLQLIIDAAFAMLSSEDEDQVLVPLNLIRLLPQGHPGKNYGTRAAGRDRTQGP